MNNKNSQLIVIFIFLLAVIWYFFPIGKDLINPHLFALRLAFPAAVLTLGAVRISPPLITIAFLFCTIGDVMGVMKCFEGQMGSFAIAQIWFIVLFVKQIMISITNKDKRPSLLKITISATFFCFPVLVIAALKVIPAVPGMPLRVGCFIYAILLLAAVWTSIVRCYCIYDFYALAGCVIFLISDSILGWNKFVCHIQYAALYILGTYYTALLLIFCGTPKSKSEFHKKLID